MKFILGKKITMTQKFKADGQVVPVTIVEAGPCFITQVKSSAKDRYDAIQVGYGIKKKLNKPLSGHLKNTSKARYLKELRLEIADKFDYKIGQKITVNAFAIGDIVKVTGITKGQGFQGVVKRHGFHGSPKTHGTKDQLRHSGSVGAKGVAHVFKGTKMGGRMGGVQVTVTNLEIISIEPEKNLLYIKGALPGCRNGLVEICAPGEMKVEEPATIKDAEVIEKPATEQKEELKQEEVKNEEIKIEEKKV
jgi:large subunit ribosomal protein L3